MTLAERIVTLTAAACAAIAIALMLTCTGCSVRTSGPIPVVLATPMTVNATVQTRPWCYVSEPPTAPELAPVDTDNADIIGRVMIHRRDYAEMVQFAHDTQLWMQTMKNCLERWVEQP